MSKLVGLKCVVSNSRTRMLATHEHVISGGRLLSHIWDPWEIVKMGLYARKGTRNEINNDW